MEGDSLLSLMAGFLLTLRIRKIPSVGNGSKGNCWTCTSCPSAELSFNRIQKHLEIMRANLKLTNYNEGKWPFDSLLSSSSGWKLERTHEIFLLVAISRQRNWDVSHIRILNVDRLHQIIFKRFKSTTSLKKALFEMPSM